MQTVAHLPVAEQCEYVPVLGQGAVTSITCSMVTLASCETCNQQLYLLMHTHCNLLCSPQVQH